MIRVEGHSHLYRDKKTGAIINTDNIGYQNYLKSSNLAEDKKRELDNMKKDIDDIKGALKEILNKLT